MSIYLFKNIIEIGKTGTIVLVQVAITLTDFPHVRLAWDKRSKFEEVKHYNHSGHCHGQDYESMNYSDDELIYGRMEYKSVGIFPSR